jgi:hypothetical protein
LMQEYAAGIINEGLTDEHAFLEIGYGYSAHWVTISSFVKAARVVAFA